jgi:N-acetylglucosamine-6-sulfatase
VIKRARRVAVPLLAFALLVQSGAGASEPRRGSEGARAARTIVLILTDDQRWDTTWAMPTVRSELADRGVTFKNAFVVNALCCPSRASILTGRYSHGTRVYSNGGRFGGFASFKDVSTVATWLDKAGYRTAWIGKYLNQYVDANASYIPPGWDRWYAVTSNPYNAFTYHASDNGTVVAPRTYQTDLLASKAASFIRSARPADPLFLVFAPTAPHPPSTPPSRYSRAFSSLHRWRPPSYDEGNVADKPRYIRGLPRLSQSERDLIDGLRLKQYRSLLAVDDGVRTILRALRDTGRLSTSLVVYTSDNGFLWGEHRWMGKMVPYEESIRVPMIVRYDPLARRPRADYHFALNIDIPATVAAAAGVRTPPVDGKSLLPLLVSASGPWRTDFLVEHSGGGTGGTKRWGGVPIYCAVRGKSFVYVAYNTGEDELYDLIADPRQLTDVASVPRAKPMLNRGRARARALCSPPPPGWNRW